MSTNELETARILIVDDQEANVRLLERILRQAGYREVRGVTSPRDATALTITDPPDLLLLDLHMPAMDGFAVLDELQELLRSEDFFPVVVLTADVSPEARRLALSRGARDFLLKPFDGVEVLLRIRNLLETRFLHLALRERNSALEERVRERTRDLQESQQEVLERLAQAAELHDDETGLHTRRVGELCGRLAERLRLPPEEVELIRRTAPLHDIGKIAIPDAVLRKPGPLDEGERAIMKAHTTVGARILAGGRSEAIRMAEEIALCHHERWDGGGYPLGRGEEEIPLAARIVAVADVFDALAHDRPYRQAWPVGRVVGTIRAEQGRHFDPLVVEAFESVLAEGGVPMGPQ